MNRSCSLIVVVTIVAALRADARACDPIGNLPHILDPSMQATDHTPPPLPAIPAAVTHYEEGSSNGNRLRRWREVRRTAAGSEIPRWRPTT
jgi:hypothetical protein